MRSLRLLALLPLAACGREFDLPPAPDRGPPALSLVQPSIAVASLGSPLLLQGENLDMVDEVRIGAYSLKREDGRIQPMRGGLLVNVMGDVDTEWVSASADGRRAPIRLVSEGREYVTGEDVRLFTGRAEIEEIAPTTLAPGELIFLRGRGFDPDLLEANDLRLAPEGATCEGTGGTGTTETGTGAPPDLGDGGGSAGEGADGPLPVVDGCIEADVFWVTDGLIVAIVPEQVAGGVMQVRYWNRTFLEIDQFVAAQMADGASADAMYGDVARSAGDGGGGVDGSGGGGGAAPENGSLGSVPPDAGAGVSDMEGGTVIPMASVPEYRSTAQDQVYVWQDPGRISTAPDARPIAGGVLQIRAQRRIYYEATTVDGDVIPHPELQVLIDGRPAVVTAAALPPAGWPGANVLDVELPIDLSHGMHALQVVNPFFDSGLLWLSL